MHHRPATAAGCHRTPDQERSLNEVTFVGSFPTADFTIEPPLPEIAFLGRSNVGKSSLINAIVGRKAIARTSKRPGKTRDCNVYRVGDQLHLVDLPGYGYAHTSQAERRRIGKLIDVYLRTREVLSGVVWLLDVRRDPAAHDLELRELLGERAVPLLVAVTKGDKLGRGRRADRARAILETLGVGRDQALVTSAVTREGVVELRESILALAAEARSEGRP